MDIRRLSNTSRTAPLSGRQTPAHPPAAGQSAPQGAPRDRYEGRQPAEPEADVPFWLVAMSTDRLARRQYLSAPERKAAARLEAAWLRQIADSAKPAIALWEAALEAAPVLADWQALATTLTQAAGGFPAPRVVWLPGLPNGRGQFLFRLDGNLLQLKPGAAGTPTDWVATVAHEVFHHLQQELVTALYRGTPALGDPLDRLAAYYRDARNAYDALGLTCPPDRHRRQALEVGAWSFGEAIARHLAPPDAAPQRG